MNGNELYQALEEMWATLDELQETDFAQNSEELMWEIGEAMGAIDNALDIIEDIDKE